MNWQPPPPPPKPNQGSQGGAPQTQNYYDLLQVTPGAHPTIIRYAYRFLAGIYHPDNHETGSPEAFRQISEAFKTLSDSGRRMAYDAHLGPMLKKESDAAAAAAASLAGQNKQQQNKPLQFEKTSLSYNEIELRLAILQLLLQARKKRVQTGGCSAKTLMDVLGVDMGEMEFALWYLRERGYIERQEAQFLITVSGVDYIVDSLTKTQIIDEGPKSVPNYGSGGGSSPNLPVTTR